MTLVQTLQTFFSSHQKKLKSQRSVLVACSGGPDSVALSWGLKKIEGKLPFSFHLAHVHHGLRGKESDRDAVFVEGLSKRIEWPFHFKKIRISAKSSGNLEEKARVERYKALTALAQLKKCGG